MRQHVLILAAFIALLGGYVTTSWADEPVDTAVLGQVLDQWAVAWSSDNVDKLLLLFTEDVFYEDVTFGAVNKGKEALRNFATAGFEAFPGSTFEVKSRFVASDGKWGALEWVWRGKQTKDVPGLPAMHMPFEVRGASVVEFRDAKISRCSDYWDLTTYMKQVGLSK
jgi:steroid delta-isomerase-like uncharacterized protein